MLAARALALLPLGSVVVGLPVARSMVTWVDLMNSVNTVVEFCAMAKYYVDVLGRFVQVMHTSGFALS